MDRDFSKLVVGDNVFVASFLGSWGGPQYTKGVVRAITPSGMIDVLIGHSTEWTRFNADGRARGKYNREQLDGVMTFEERQADLAKQVRRELANAALTAVQAE